MHCGALLFPWVLLLKISPLSCLPEDAGRRIHVTISLIDVSFDCSYFSVIVSYSCCFPCDSFGLSLISRQADTGPWCVDSAQFETAACGTNPVQCQTAMSRGPSKQCREALLSRALQSTRCIWQSYDRELPEIGSSEVKIKDTGPMEPKSFRANFPVLQDLGPI